LDSHFELTGVAIDAAPQSRSATTELIINNLDFAYETSEPVALALKLCSFFGLRRIVYGKHIDV